MANYLSKPCPGGVTWNYREARQLQGNDRRAQVARCMQCGSEVRLTTKGLLRRHVYYPDLVDKHELVLSSRKSEEVTHD